MSSTLSNIFNFTVPICDLELEVLHFDEAAITLSPFGIVICVLIKAFPFSTPRS
jgi:hypothetical protein